MSLVYHPYITCMLSVCHSYVTCMYSYVIRISLICHLYATLMSLVCIVCHPYITRMSLACTRMLSVCHSSVVLPWTWGNPCVTANKIPKKSKKKKKSLYNKITFSAVFVHCLCDLFQLFSQWKKFFSSGNKVFRVDVNFIKEIHFDRETFQLKKWKFSVWNIVMMIKRGL